MAKLLSTYAKSTGLKIGNLYLREHFFPIPFPKYITIQTGSGQAAKNYDYFQEVIFILKPILDSNGIGIVHIGAKEDPQLNGVYDLRGKTSIPQSAYIIKRASAHLGNDSWIQHYSCFNKVPTVALFGSTSSANHGSYWATDSTIFMESHRCGKKPTFMSQENPKTINFIQPERVAENLIKLIGGNLNIPFDTIFIGKLYNEVIIELIPNFQIDMQTLPNLSIVVRMDLENNERNLFGMISSGRKVNILTNKELSDLRVVEQFKDGILSYNHEVDMDTDLNYVKTIKKIIPNHRFYSKLPEGKELDDLRFRFFDVAQILQLNDISRENVLSESSRFLNKKLDDFPSIDNLKFKSNKFILSLGQIYTSFAHLKAKRPVPSLDQNMSEVIDSPDFWKDANNILIINTHEQDK